MKVKDTCSTLLQTPPCPPAFPSRQLLPAHLLPLKSLDLLARARVLQEGLLARRVACRVACRAAHRARRVACRAAVQFWVPQRRWLWICSALALFPMPTGDLQVHPSQQNVLAPNLGKANAMRYREGEPLLPRVFAETDVDAHKWPTHARHCSCCWSGARLTHSSLCLHICCHHNLPHPKASTTSTLPELWVAPSQEQCGGGRLARDHGEQRNGMTEG